MSHSAHKATVGMQPRTRSIRSHAKASLGAWGRENRCTELSNSFAPPVPIISPGELLEESQMEASRLRQKAEELVKDSELLPPPSPSLASFDHLAELTGTGGPGLFSGVQQTPKSLDP